MSLTRHSRHSRHSMDCSLRSSRSSRLDCSTRPSPRGWSCPIRRNAVTCCPTVRLTDATVPEMVEVNEASDKSVCADVREDSAEVTAAWSESICAVLAPDD